MSGRGLLIVNGDDWGASATTSDAMLRCVEAGAVTSVSAMVHMADSHRAAELAREMDIPTGLHLNLTQAFDGDDVPRPVRERQGRIASRMQGVRGGAGVWTPNWLSAVRSATADQLDEFERLYGSPPSHVDGHEHVHQSLPVLMAGRLPSGTKIRPPLTFMPGEKSAANRAARSMANRVERVRFRMPRYFFSLRDMHPDLGGRDLDEKLALSSGAAVEVMTHPSWDDEQALLLDADWRSRIALRPLGSYRDL